MYMCANTRNKNKITTFFKERAPRYVVFFFKENNPRLFICLRVPQNTGFLCMFSLALLQGTGFIG